jgi:hypothetical protein
MAKAALLYKLFGQVLIFLNEDFVLLLTCKMFYRIPTQHIYGIVFILCCLYYWYFTSAYGWDLIVFSIYQYVST